MREYDLIIIGGGATGILSSIYAKNNGIENILLIEKDPILGGSLNLGNYNISKNKNITGIEYKENIMTQFQKLDIDVKLETMVLKIENDRYVLCTSKNGIEKIKGKNIILANGAKDTGRKAISMVGSRCSGILTVGMAKKIFNMKNIIPGKNVLIFGNHTLYMIEKELKQHKTNVVGIVKNSNNEETFKLTNNIYDDYNIATIKGDGRVEEVVLIKDGIQKNIKCDTLIFANPMLSDGVVAMRSGIKLNPKTTGPEVNSKYMTSKQNVFSCGNNIYVHEFIEDIENECKEVIKNIKIS